MSATETRQRLFDYQSFLLLTYALHKKRSRQSDELRMELNAVSEFLCTASSRDIRERGKELKALFLRAVAEHEKMLPRKKGAREIGRDFQLLIQAEPDVWRFGIPNGWLLERFDISRLPQAEDLPRHARVGIGLIDWLTPR